MKYKIYTDGVADNFIAPHYGGYAWRSIDENGEFIDGCGFADNTTGNRMAMVAIINALGKIQDNSECEVYTNNQYVTYPFGNRDKEYTANSDLIGEFWSVIDEKHIKCNVVWKKACTDALLDEMRDLSLGQFYTVSDKELTDSKKYKNDIRYHKEINDIIRGRNEIYNKN